MFNTALLNKLAISLLVVIVSMWALTGLWNWVMPVLGVVKLTVWQFSALFVIVHSLTFEIVSFKKSSESIKGESN